MDIVILCINQKQILPTFIEGYYLEKLFDINESKDYCSDNSINGSLYYVFSEKTYYNDDIIAGTCDIVDTIEQNHRDSYITLDNNDYTFFNKNMDYTFDSIYFLKGKKNNFKKLLKYIIDCSETSTCLILFRRGLECPEKVVGPITISTFFKMVNLNKIYTNVEYIIKK